MRESAKRPNGWTQPLVAAAPVAMAAAAAPRLGAARLAALLGCTPSYRPCIAAVEELLAENGRLRDELEDRERYALLQQRGFPPDGDSHDVAAATALSRAFARAPGSTLCAKVPDSLKRLGIHIGGSTLLPVGGRGDALDEYLVVGVRFGNRSRYIVALCAQSAVRRWAREESSGVKDPSWPTFRYHAVERAAEWRRVPSPPRATAKRQRTAASGARPAEGPVVSTQ